MNPSKMHGFPLIIPAKQAYAPDLEKIMFEAIYDKVGPAGTIIAILSFISLYLFLASAVYLAWIPRGFRTFLAALKKNQPSVTEDQAQKNPLSLVVWTALAHQTPRAELQGEISYLFQRNFGRTTVSLTILRLISVISPLLGLLGTVLGISRVFREISMQAVVDNAAMAGGIWEALITTIMGMSVAIPTLVFYYLLRMRTRALLMDCMESTRDLMRS